MPTWSRKSSSRSPRSRRPGSGWCPTRAAGGGRPAARAGRWSRWWWPPGTVHSASTAASKRRQRSGVDARVRYVRELRPGLSCARNRGLGEALGELVAFTDDDVVVDPGWLDGVVRGFDRSQSVACVTGLVPSARLDTAEQRYFDRRVSWALGCTPRRYDRHPDPQASPLHPYTA